MPANNPVLNTHGTRMVNALIYFIILRYMLVSLRSTGRASRFHRDKNLVKIHYTEFTADYHILKREAVIHVSSSSPVELVPRFSFTAFQNSVMARFTQF